MKSKRLTTLLLCVLMIVALFPAGAFASEDIMTEEFDSLPELWIPEDVFSDTEPVL